MQPLTTFFGQQSMFAWFEETLIKWHQNVKVRERNLYDMRNNY